MVGQRSRACRWRAVFEAALRRAGQPVEASYYEGGGHNGFFSNAAQRDREVERMLSFFRRHLAD